jgi:hypothetical protein
VPAKEIPNSVKQLILARIDSVPELETILLLREQAEHSWTAVEAGQRIYVSPAVAAHILKSLAERGFLACSESGYSYWPETDELRKTVDDLADAYAKHLVEVTRMIHGKPSSSVRQFADAFVLGKDK